jgi:hypothetical protein
MFATKLIIGNVLFGIVAVLWINLSGTLHGVALERFGVALLCLAFILGSAMGYLLRIPRKPAVKKAAPFPMDFSVFERIK